MVALFKKGDRHQAIGQFHSTCHSQPDNGPFRPLEHTDKQATWV